MQVYQTGLLARLQAKVESGEPLLASDMVELSEIVNHNAVKLTEVTRTVGLLVEELNKVQLKQSGLVKQTIMFQGQPTVVFVRGH